MAGRGLQGRYREASINALQSVVQLAPALQCTL